MTNTEAPQCPEYAYPLDEPAYNAKVPRDLGPFQTAIDSQSDERSAELETLLRTVTLASMQALMDSEQLTSLELVTYYVKQIARYDLDRLNAILTLDPDALAIAAERDGERAVGTVRGRLHGVPVMLKDNIATADLPTTAGAFALRNWQPERDAFLVSRLRGAGAIILGKTNLSEFANYTDPCTPNGFSTLGGQTQNPYGPFDPLGSSSGSAVAIATGFASGSVGTETQGSIIMPALVNGVVGLKTSIGLVSRDGIVPLLEPQDVPGPFGRTVTDVAVLLSAMAGVDDNDQATYAATDLNSVDFQSWASLEAAGGLRVGVVALPPDDPADSVPAKYPRLTAATADRVAAVLAGQGLSVTRIDSTELEAMPKPSLGEVLPYGFREGYREFMAVWANGTAPATLAEVAAINSEDPSNRVPYGQRFVVGAAETAMTAEEFAAATAANRAGTRQAIRALLTAHEVDVLVVPPLFQQFAAAGFPALAVPDGLDENGRPQGIVLTGDYLSESQLLAVGYALEQARGEPVSPALT